MLSYIHAYHAGNHADILKHIVLSLSLEHLLKKEKPFTIIDTHAGSGIYNLEDLRAKKTGEAEQGITTLLKKLDSMPSSPLNSLRFIQITRAYAKKKIYPGSPEFSRLIKRNDDKLFLNELHPTVIQELKSNMPDSSISIQQKNASDFLNAVVPPQIKRGLCIIDPSYEDEKDFSDTALMFINAYKKWSNAVYLIWYPLIEHKLSQIQTLKEKVEQTVEQNLSESQNLKEKFSIFELKIKDPSKMTGLSSLYGSGMIVVNTPYGLNEQMPNILRELNQILSE